MNHNGIMNGIKGDLLAQTSAFITERWFDFQQFFWENNFVPCICFF